MSGLTPRCSPTVMVANRGPGVVGKTGQISLLLVAIISISLKQKGKVEKVETYCPTQATKDDIHPPWAPTIDGGPLIKRLKRLITIASEPTSSIVTFLLPDRNQTLVQWSEIC